MRGLIRIALRSLTGHARRYTFVVIVLSLGFTFITLATSISLGMEQAVTNAALRHYAGHIFVIGRDRQGGHKMVIDHPEKVEAAIERAGVPVERVLRRTHEHRGAQLFFHGRTVQLKDLFGVDFRGEEDLFRSFDYIAGRFDKNRDADSIILSRPTADQLGVRAGDEVVLRVETRKEQVDTRTLTVQAVTADSSIYGYARAYTDRQMLSSLMDLSPAKYSMLGIFLPERSEAPQWAKRLHRELDKVLPTAGRIETKEQLTAEIRKRWDNTRYFVFPLPVYISEVTDLLSAMEFGSYTLLFMIILVVLTATVVTYRVVLHDRLREFGTMLAVGFPRYQLITVLLLEAIIIFGVGMGGGLLISRGITEILSYLSFDWIPGFEIFLQEGRLTARYTLESLGTNIAIVLAVVLPVVTAMVTAVVRREIPTLIKGETT